MDYTIYPYEGVGPVRFGMTMQQVHEILGEPKRTIERPGNVTAFTDDYYSLGLHVLYGEDRNCNALQLFRPASPVLNKRFLLQEEPFSTLREWFSEQDGSAENREDGFKSFLYGIALYGPYPSEPTKKIYVFERGHYDGLAEKIAEFEVEYKRRRAAGLPIDDLLRS
jgi:hypothetical protein